MIFKPQRSLKLGLYMVMVTCSVAKVPTVPLATVIRQEVFGWRNNWVLDDCQRKLKIKIFGYPPAREMTDEEYFGWTA
jgi:hypothetical protein